MEGINDNAKVLTISVTDEELGAVKAEGVDTNVYYNALITGHIKTSGNATLMEIGDEKISLTKYNNGQKVSLGTDGTTGEILDETIEIVRITNPEEETGTDTEDDFIPAVPNTGKVGYNVYK